MRCYSSEFDCDDGTCIDGDLVCDGYNNCKYRYDEDPNTTCLRGEPLIHPSINQLIDESLIIDYSSHCLPSFTGNTGSLILTSEHMIIILIVFFALVLGMCASITVSCWGKIQERRQRKLEYKMRRSRDASMEKGLDRSLTSTSLDRQMADHLLTSQMAAAAAAAAAASDQQQQQQMLSQQVNVLGSATRSRKSLANQQTAQIMRFSSEDENPCYVPDVDLR